MKAICVADIHGDMSRLFNLRNAVEGLGVEYFFLLGDYSKGFKDAEENRSDISMMLETLRDFRVKAMPGNCDQLESAETFSRLGISLHNTVIRLPEANIIGLGGSNPTPFSTPFEYREEDIAENLKALHTMIDNDNPTILMTHFPPKDTKCDMIAGETHVGSVALRDFIKSKQPELALCSHIHESGGHEDRIGKTRVINLGRLSDGMAYLLEVEDDIKIGLFTG